MEQNLPGVPLAQPDSPKHTGARLLIALCLGVCMATVAVISGVQGAGRHYATWPTRATQERLSQITNALSLYRASHAALPTNLLALRETYRRDLWFDEAGQLHDGWHKPIMYFTDGTNYLAWSYGRDGKAGGTGCDCDLTTANIGAKQAELTLGQLFNELPTERIWAAGFWAGVLSAVLAFFAVRPRALDRGQRAHLMVSLVLTLVVAGGAATIMGALHFSGH